MLRLEPTIDLIAGEPEPKLSENALRVLEKRYLKKDETGPEATPVVDRTKSPFGRSREKENPVPPPDW